MCVGGGVCVCVGGGSVCVCVCVGGGSVCGCMGVCVTSVHNIDHHNQRS